MKNANVNAKKQSVNFLPLSDARYACHLTIYVEDSHGYSQTLYESSYYEPGSLCDFIPTVRDMILHGATMTRAITQDVRYEVAYLNGLPYVRVRDASADGNSAIIADSRRLEPSPRDSFFNSLRFRIKFPDLTSGLEWNFDTGSGIRCAVKLLSLK